MTDGWAIWLVKYLLWWPLKRLFVYVPELLALMAVADCWLAWTLWRNPKAWRGARWVVVLLFLLGSWTHATFAAFGWGGRYEAYLLALGLVVLGVALPSTDWATLLRNRSRAILVGVLAVAFALAGGLRAWHQHHGLAARAETVALRDVWPAQAIEALCRAAPCELRVMAMNIGALSWYAGPRLTDLLALGDREVLALMRERRLDSAAVRRLAEARDIDLALIFDDWYAEVIGGGPPLVKIATLMQQTDWPTPLSIYARDQSHAARVAAALKRVTRTTPPLLSITYEPAFQ